MKDEIRGEHENWVRWEFMEMRRMVAEEIHGHVGDCVDRGALDGASIGRLNELFALYQNIDEALLQKGCGVIHEAAINE